MLVNKNLTNYQILALENGYKIESIQNIVLKRDDVNAHQAGLYTGKIHAQYQNKKWSQVIEPWLFEYRNLKFILKQGKSHHIGVFPEQSSNWDWLEKQCQNYPDAKVLNLFAYTGGASFACAQAGATEVVHVDALKSAVEWAKENAKINQLENHHIRYIVEDARKFVQREVKRHRQYEGIVLDPPSFGRGPKGQIWKLEEDLKPLLESLMPLLKEQGRFLVLNTYSPDFPKEKVEAILREVLKMHGLPVHTKAYDLGFKVQNTDALLNQGQTVRWCYDENNL